MTDTLANDPLQRLDTVLLHHIVNTLGWKSLRPLQQEAIDPLLSGSDAVLLAPTAAGKTEAAAFPLLSRMAAENWTGTSVLYVCPLKALLNNLLPRLETYTSWLGRTTALWHGDVTQPRRKAILRQRPDILLTTPESLESMLVSVNVDHHAFFQGLRTIVVDEVHAFAGDDRGWHLLAVLERLQRVVGRPVQRVGLSATVGNPEELLHWLQGASAGTRPAKVIAPHLHANPDTGSGAAAGPPPGDVQLDYVGSLSNAATVIAALHRGEKRLVFCESRRQVEELGETLRAKGITTFLSHASLSVDERRRAEEAFADARDCVIVSTSTLELGIDVGDLGRVIRKRWLSWHYAQQPDPGGVAESAQTHSGVPDKRGKPHPGVRADHCGLIRHCKPGAARHIPTTNAPAGPGQPRRVARCQTRQHPQPVLGRQRHAGSGGQPPHMAATGPTCARPYPVPTVSAPSGSPPQE